MGNAIRHFLFGESKTTITFAIYFYNLTAYTTNVKVYNPFIWHVIKFYDMAFT